MKITKAQICNLINNFKANNASPYVVEVLGTPNSGKTPAIQTFEKILKRNGVKYKIIYEAATECKIKNKLSPEFNIWTLSETIEQLLEAYSANYDIVICERGLLDAACWFELYYQDKSINEEEYQTLLNYIFLNRFVSRVNCCFIMECSVETSIHRENLTSFLETTGTIVNSAVLTKYNHALDLVRSSYSKKFSNIINLDTTSSSQTEINRSFVSSILKHIESISNVPVG